MSFFTTDCIVRSYQLTYIREGVVSNVHVPPPSQWTFPKFRRMESSMQVPSVPSQTLWRQLPRILGNHMIIELMPSIFCEETDEEGAILLLIKIIQTCNRNLSNPTGYLTEQDQRINALLLPWGNWWGGGHLNIDQVHTNIHCLWFSHNARLANQWKYFMSSVFFLSTKN